MDAGAYNELNSIISELETIIRELENISQGIRRDFKNIGNDKCADCIDCVVENYYYVRNRLYNMDTTTVTESFSKAHGGGGF